MPHPDLTPDLGRLIVSYVRSGCYSWLAAEAAGVSRSLFEDWLRRGRSGEPPYRAFFDEIQQAQAQARVRAEVAVLQSHPLYWLRYGPGRETTDTPGWSVPVPALAASEQTNVLHSPPILKLLQALEEVLRRHPEAREAVLVAFKSFDTSSRPLLPPS